MKVMDYYPIGNDEWNVVTKGEDENQAIVISNMHMDIDEFLGRQPCFGIFFPIFWRNDNMASVCKMYQ